MNIVSNLDAPDKIIENSIIGQRVLLSGFGGNKKTNLAKLREAQEPMHFAISLTGEPLAYPKISSLIRLLHKKNKTTFVVSNGQLPEEMKEMELPTQLYVSVDAPNESCFMKVDRPSFSDGWSRLMNTLRILKSLKEKTRTTLRFTIIKGVNDIDIDGWADIIRLAEPMFVEVKAYMFVGSSRLRLSIDNMPRHHEIMDFSVEIAKKSGYKLIDEKPESRVVLLMKSDFDGRIMQF